MANRSPPRKGLPSKPIKDRRAADEARGPLRRLKGLLVRPLSLERRDGKLQLTLAERRRPKPADEAPTPSQLCAELSARMLAHEVDQTARTMRHLVLVHDVLERKGWAGVAAMSGHVLTEALDQLEMLACEDPSPHLDRLVDGLRPLQEAAELREERDSRLQDFDVGSNLVVSESDFAEFEDVERGWTGTVPSGLARPDKDD